MRRPTMFAVAAAAAVIASGCGSDSASLSETNDTPTDQTDSGGTDSGGGDIGAPDPSDVAAAGDALGNAFGEECGQAIAAWSALLGTAFTGQMTPEQQQQFKDFEADVPDEIADDVAIYAEFFDAINNEGMAAATALAEDPKFDEAGKNISDYFEKNCDTGG